MAAPDFSKMTTDDLLEIIPPTETAEWEFKSAKLFDKSQFADFKKNKLGKIVSSFANSGGGFLLLGKLDGQPVFEQVPTHEGRLAMEDHLSLVMSQSVAPHYRDFKIHRVTISGKTNESVLVVEFLDSIAAPHQSIADVNYFYRLPGHCVAAPHFHLDLLRNRYTKAVVAVAHASFHIHIPPFAGMSEQYRNKIAFCVDAFVKVENRSHQIADPCALRVSSKNHQSAWTSKDVSLNHGRLVTHEDPLFPTLDASFKVEMRVVLDDNGPLVVDHLLPAWEVLELDVQPFSQNFAGELVHYRPSEWLGEAGTLMLQTAVKGYHQTKEKMAEATGRLAEALQNVKVPRHFL